MKILTFVKHVPTSAVTPRIADTGDRIEDDGLQFEANEADIYAIEEALHQKSVHGGEVVSVTIGPDRAKEALHLALAKGVDDVRHVLDPRFQGNNPVLNRMSAAAVVETIAPDLVLCGVQAEDDLQGEFGITLGHALDIPVITAVTEIDIHTSQKTATVVREIGGGYKEEIEVDLPAILTIQYGIRPLRYTPIMSIVKMRKRPIEAVAPESLGIPPNSGSDGSGMRVVEFSYPEAGGKCELIDGTPDHAADRIIKHLAEMGVLRHGT